MKFDYQSGRTKEWLITNGLGGYASSTLIGANTRKYHGLLVAALQPPSGRRLLVSKLEESVTVDGVSYELSANRWLDGTIHPTGYEHLEGSGLFPIPAFRYVLPTGAKVKKEIFMAMGSNASVARYTVDSDVKTKIEIAPLANNRSIHSNTHEELVYRQISHPHGCAIAFGDGAELFLDSDKASFEPKQLVFRDMFYDVEAERGQDPSDTHVCPGIFSVETPGRAVFSIIMSAGPRLEDVDAIYGRSIAQADETISGQKDWFAKLLALACDSFVVSGTHGKTIVAGYHWFGEWGRDAMIALPGLTLECGRFGDAREILRNFAHLARHDGLIPDSRPEGEGEPLRYGSADASLWFVNSAYLYMSRTRDEKFVRTELWPVIEKLVDSYSKGVPDGTKEDEDGLIVVSSPGRTWMDAFVDGRAVVPRTGKPVEVNALWHNALCIAAEMEKRFENGGGELPVKAEKTERSFLDKFWNEKSSCLYDTIEPENGSVRPNQVIALSLPFGPKLPPQRARRVMEVAKAELLTPAGLRSLSFRDPKYRGKYSGPLSERDAAYHQGTVWPWLIGPYCDACCNYGLAYPDMGFFEGFAKRCGTIPEIFEADTLRPDGCISQAWSVAEVLRAHLKTKV